MILLLEYLDDAIKRNDSEEMIRLIETTKKHIKHFKD